MAELCETCKGSDVNEALVTCLNEQMMDDSDSDEEMEEAQKRHEGCVELLVKAGANVNMKSEVNGVKD